MKSWTVSELNNVIAASGPLVGLRLQEIRTSERDVLFGFYSSAGIMWLWVDLTSASPSLLPWVKLPSEVFLVAAKKKSPIHLFLRAHFVGKVLTGIHHVLDLGRVVHLEFSNGGKIEIRLFPHGQNLLAFASDKRVAWQKPQALTGSGPGEPPHLNRSEAAPSPASPSIRFLDQLRDEWIQGRNQVRGSSTKKKAVNPMARLEKDIEKLERAAAKVKQELQHKREMPWREIGNWLKTNQSLDVPKEWEPFVDRRRKLSWNIELCFEKAADMEQKIRGTESRLAKLNSDIQVLQTRLASAPSSVSLQSESRQQGRGVAGDSGSDSDSSSYSGSTARNQITARGRTLHLSDHQFVIAGKSARDNIEVLRKARAWDLWFHLRDFPSSHAVLFRNKNDKVSDRQLFLVADWFLRNHFGQKFENNRGLKFDIVVVECRFVKPIKGDKLGRATYHGERVLTYQIPATVAT